MRRPLRQIFWLLACVGFSSLTLGFLTSAAFGDVVDDAVRCLEDQSMLEEGRDRLLRQADSLGARIEERRVADRDVPDDWLRAAEQLQRQAVDRELGIVELQRRCRDLAARALDECRERIDAILLRIESGEGTPEDGIRLQQLREIRDRLSAGAAGVAVLGYPVLPPAPDDTQETLRAKLQYHQDVVGYLERLDRRVAERVSTLEEEKRVLEDARRFVRDLSFLDEGGRVDAGGSARLRGGTPGEPLPGDGLGRIAGSAEVAGGSDDLDFVLGLTPTTPEETDRLVALLRGFRREIRDELDALSEATESIRERILPEVPAPR